MSLSEKVGGGGQNNSPVEHITALSLALKAHQTRLIYVALPLKLSIYPELVAPTSAFKKGASTLPQFRQMILELLQNNVEVIDMHPIFMRNKSSSHLFAKEHHISCDGAILVALTIAEYLKFTTNFTAEEEFESQSSENPNKVTIYKNGQIYVANNSGKSPFGIFGNCNLQAYHEKGAGIASNLAFYLGKELDYLGRKLIFCGENGLSPKNEIFDAQTFEECAKRDIVICISFLSGSFVRTSITANKHKLDYLSKILRGKTRFHYEWSGLDLDSLST